MTVHKFAFQLRGQGLESGSSFFIVFLFLVLDVPGGSRLCALPILLARNSPKSYDSRLHGLILNSAIWRSAVWKYVLERLHIGS